MSNPLITTPHSKVDSRVSGVGSTHGCFNSVFQNKNYQSFDKQLVQNYFTEGHIENNAIEGQIENNAIEGSKKSGMRGEQYNDFAI